MTLLAAPVSSSTVAAILCRIAAEPNHVEALHDLLGDFCHLVRNRLNSLQIGLYLAKSGAADPRSSSWSEAEAHCRDAVQVIELIQAVCRPIILQPMVIGLDLVLQDFANRWAPRFQARGSSLELACPAIEEPSRIDLTRVAIAMDAFASWRLDEAEANTSIALTGRSERGRTRIEWSEASSPDDFARGALGMGALCRVASALGGRLLREDGPGLTVTVEWPNRETAPGPLTSA